MLAIFALFFAGSVNAQNLTITGEVIDEDGSTLPGVSIVIKGTTSGTISDMDGKFQLEANNGTILVFNFVGYVDEEVTIENQSEVNVRMIPDLVGLDEVVVIGYGVQKKKLNTGATVNVKGEDIQRLNTVSAVDALKTNSPGVTVTSNNGVPGSGSKVTIRGIGTMGNASPLYVVDGVAVGNIDFLSPADIESMDILKDAASTAIYGSRAANGVVLVTTKKGTTKSKPSVTLDSYFGWQQIAKRPGQVDAQTYMQLIDEGWVGQLKSDGSPGSPVDWEKQVGNDWEDYYNGTNPGTNWIDQLYNENAPVQSHALNITGGNTESSYSMGVGYLEQVGILGDPSYSTYKRLNLRLNSDHNVIKHKDKTVFRVGQVFTYSNAQKPNVATGGIYWNDLHAALVTHPLLPMYADENTPEEYGDYHEPIPWATGASNPVASSLYNRRYNENDNNTMVGNFYAEILPIKNMTIRSVYGFDGGFGSSRAYTERYKLGDLNERIDDGMRQTTYQNYTWTLSNTIAYNFSVANQHNFTVLAGQELRKSSKNLKLETSRDSIELDWDHAYIDNTPADYKLTQVGIQGRDYYGYAMESYFGRISYDFNETLLATFVYRADGSNNLAPGNQWGSFMSASLGYILTNHDFMSSVPGLDYLKIRGGWGQNGNERIDAFQYNSSLTDENGYYFYGTDPNVIAIGRYPELTPNPNIGWEVSEQTSIGFDANFLNNRLQTTFDWYNKATKDWLVEVPKPTSNGTTGAVENGGAINNRGVELSVRWVENLGDFKYSIGANMAYNKNEVTQLNAAGASFNGESPVLQEGTSFVNRVEVGYPIGYFYGLETDGIMQNAEEVAAYVVPDTVDSKGNSIPYFRKAQPGDLRFVDQNGDGKINDDDKIQIGDPTPDFTYGLNISVEYKGIYLAVAAEAATGHQVAMSYRPGAQDAFSEYHLGRWTEENPSTTQPRITKETSHWNYQNISDYYIHDADFLRISNITVGYDMNKLFSKSPMKEVRIYFTGQNLFTFTQYPGMTPEVGYGGGVDWGSGVDLGLYPQAKTYMIGLSAKF